MSVKVGDTLPFDIKLKEMGEKGPHDVSVGDIFKGKKVGRNPWGSRGYEWNSPSPPPKNNFDCPQVFDHPPHDYDSEGHEPEMQTEVHGGSEVHGKGGNNHG